MKKPKNKEFSGTSPVHDSTNALNEFEDIQSDDSDSDGIFNNSSEESEESSEEEVLALNSGSDIDTSDDDMNEDVSDEDEKINDENNVSDSDIDRPNDDFPDSKAWGKRKKVFYNADHINDKNDYLNEEDEEAAKLEEEEGKIIQKRLISEIDNADLSLDLLSDVIAEKKEELDIAEKDKIAVNLSEMNHQDKLKLLKKESPQFLSSIDDYKRLMKLLQDELLPKMKLLKPNQLQTSSAGKFLKVYSQLIMNYCTNVSFYILLKTRRSDSVSHPIHDWITRYQKVLRDAELVYTTQIKPQVEQLSNDDIDSVKTNKKKNKRKSSSVAQVEIDSKLFKKSNVNGDSASMKPGNIASADKKLFSNGVEDEYSDDENEGKRPITYQIAKNKGLTPSRKKELRNPRVKHRMKYRKAKIRRKGQVREVRRELQKYSGEISGIKSNVVKSVKLKS